MKPGMLQIHHNPEPRRGSVQPASPKNAARTGGRCSANQAVNSGFERVYETGPVFRAEPHDTARHLAEYTSLDAELGFIGGHRDVLAVLRHALAGMTAAVRGRGGRGR